MNNFKSTISAVSECRFHILNDLNSYLRIISESPLDIDNLKSIKVQYLNNLNSIVQVQYMYLNVALT